MLNMTWADVRKLMVAFAESEHEWAGAPIPVDTLPLHLERRYPWQKLQGAKFKDDEPSAAAGPEPKVRNHWHVRGRDADVYLCEFEPGKVEKVFLPARRPEDRLKIAINCLEPACMAWDADAECRALEKLQALLKPHTFRHYVLTGTFLETSPRSGVTYFFRKLRPTVALRPDPQNTMRILAAMCLHPIGYYGGSWAGCMVPSDCVIAHLLLMRGDEHYYWRKANLHPPEAAEAGI